MTRTFNIKIIFKTMGILLIIEAFFMAIATLVSWLYKETCFEIFLYCSLFTFIIGLWGYFSGLKAPKTVGEREGYVIVAAVWLIFSVFGLLPYYLSGSVDNITDAWFETMSGFTTTGATILPDVEKLEHGILFWRALTQWLGGMGIIVLSIAILPIFGMSGMQLYAAEVTGVSYEKLSPRLSTTAKYLWTTYVILTLSEVGLLWLEGMPLFDSVCHSLSTIATGGFSTKNASISHYANPLIHYTVAFFMLISAINFAMFIYMSMGKGKKILHDEETKWYLSAVGLFTLVLTCGLFLQNWGSEMSIGQNLEQSFRFSFFTTVTTMTSSGFMLADYMQWITVLWVIVFFLMFPGGSSGSTAGGIKWVRIIIFVKSGVNEFNKRIHPNAVLPVKLNGKVVNQQTINNVMAFLFLYILILMSSILVLCGLGVTFDEAIGAAVSAIGNIGPGLGQYGPTATFATFPTVGKWILTFVMLLGRLEIFTILILFTKTLWKK